jgi:hypothetical protein
MLSEKYYLCVRKDGKKNFKCIKFNNFYEADKYYDERYTFKYHDSSILRMRSFIPEICHRILLDRKLREQFFTVSINDTDEL